MSDATQQWIAGFDDRMKRARVVIARMLIADIIGTEKICPCGARFQGPGLFCRACMGFEKRELGK